MKNTLEEINSRLVKAEDLISYFEYKVEENTQSKQTKKINEDSLRNLWGNIGFNNIFIIEIPEEEQREQEIENLFEKIMMENFPNLVKQKHTQVQEAQRVPNKLDPKRPTQDTS